MGKKIKHNRLIFISTINRHKTNEKEHLICSGNISASFFCHYIFSTHSRFMFVFLHLKHFCTRRWESPDGFVFITSRILSILSPCHLVVDTNFWCDQNSVRYVHRLFLVVLLLKSQSIDDFSRSKLNRIRNVLFHIRNVYSINTNPLRYTYLKAILCVSHALNWKSYGNNVHTSSSVASLKANKENAKRFMLWPNWWTIQNYYRKCVYRNRKADFSFVLISIVQSIHIYIFLCCLTCKRKSLQFNLIGFANEKKTMISMILECLIFRNSSFWAVHFHRFKRITSA